MNNNIEDIINKIEKSWPKDLIIKYLYNNISFLVQRDLQYFCASEEEKYRQYQNGFINRLPYIVCSTLCDYYIDLFNSLDIKAWKIKANSAKIPLFALIVEGDFGLYFIDPLSDLFNIQYGLKAQNFGVIPHYNTLRQNYPDLISLPKEYLLDLDTTINNNEKVSYTNSLIDDLSKEFKNRNSARSFFNIGTNDRLTLTQYKLEYFSDHLINIGLVKGPFERTRMYSYLFDHLLGHNEARGVKINLGDIHNQNARIYIKLFTDPYHFLLYREEKDHEEYRLKLVK